MGRESPFTLRAGAAGLVLLALAMSAPVTLRDSQVEPQISLPLNLGLNDGTYAPQGAIDALQTFDSRTSLRNYSLPENDQLREVIAELDGVSADHVFLHNGSGPILKLCIPHIIRTQIKSSVGRVLKHLTSKSGYPIITGSFTYSKVPKKAMGLGLKVEMIPLDPDKGFAFDVDRLDATLRKGDGLVYITNPNNPTGNVLITRDQLIPLLERYPGSRFWIDEAYVQYADPAEHAYISSLVSRFPNLLVSRTFSFAYGMAAVRIGYLLTQPELVREFWRQLTDYRIGTLQERMAIGALRDEQHLPWLRETCAAQRKLLREGLAEIGGIESFDSVTNFVFARFTDGRTGKMLADKLEERQILIKALEPFGPYSYEPYFRITLGLEHENRYLLRNIAEVLGAPIPSVAG